MLWFTILSSYLSARLHSRMLCKIILSWMDWHRWSWMVCQRTSQLCLACYANTGVKKKSWQSNMKCGTWFCHLKGKNTKGNQQGTVWYQEMSVQRTPVCILDGNEDWHTLCHWGLQKRPAPLHTTQGLNTWSHPSAKQPIADDFMHPVQHQKIQGPCSSQILFNDTCKLFDTNHTMKWKRTHCSVEEND